MQGSGTQADPYIISTTSDLALLSGSNYASYVGTGVYFELGADIDFEGNSFTPIGNVSYQFNGNFDGKNHVISNMAITSTAGSAGLFTRLNEGHIANLILRDCTLNETGNSNLGMLVGTIVKATSTSSEPSITNIETDGCIITSTKAFVGGIIGYGPQSTDSSCYITNCYVHDGSIQSSNNHVGGIVGIGGSANDTDDGDVYVYYHNCTVKNEHIQSSGNANVGGIVGNSGLTNTTGTHVYTGCTVENCVIYAYNNVVGGITGYSSKVGGVVIGDSTSGYECKVINCHISARNNIVGGMCGYIYNGHTTTITNPTVTKCTVTGTKSIGGIVGRSQGTGTIINPTITNCDISSSSGSLTGGAIGQNS